MVSLVAGACLLGEAVIAKDVIDVELDLLSQFVPMWIFIAYLVSGLRDGRIEIVFTAVIILAQPPFSCSTRSENSLADCM